VTKAKELMFVELVKVCQEWLENGKCVPEEVKLLDVAGMIKNRIEIVAFQDRIQGLEDKLLVKYMMCSKPLLPHVDKLPTTVVAVQPWHSPDHYVSQ
jgi:hypothetical protein